MSFCTGLHRRNSCASLIPTLVAPSELSLRENALRTHDIELQTSTPNGQPRKFRFLVLTASTTAPWNLQQTQSRIQRLSSLTGGQDSALIFLLYSSHTPNPDESNGFTTAKDINDRTISGFNAYIALQSQLVGSALSIPLLPASSPTSLSQILKNFTTSAQKVVNLPAIPVARRDLLPHCTTNPPLDPNTASVVSDLVPCLRDLATLRSYGSSAEVAEVLARSGVSAQTRDALLEFWDEEIVMHP